MAHNNSTGKYEDTYARLLRLYPKAYRKRFAEPMLQTFSDLCFERAQSGKGLFWFSVGTYAGTFVEIIKEYLKEGMMSSTATKMKVLQTAGWTILLIFIASFIVMSHYRNNRPAQSISPYSSLEQARQLSKGRKEACLMDQSHVVDAVRTDDSFVEMTDGEKWSKFEMVAGGAIMDIPAGTEYKMTIHSYENGIVRGSMAYEYGYGIYNYEIKKLSEPGEWELVSTVACERS